jgi:ATP phosphoribosyltransferase
MLKIAVPNKGQLAEPTMTLLRDAGYHCRVEGRELSCYDSKNDSMFYFIRPKDITTYVGRGILDLGITGRDMVFGSDIEVAELLALGFAKSQFYYAVPKESAITVNTLSKLRIATSYPGIVAKHLAETGQTAQIVRLDGAVEISIQLGVADVIADVVQSGKTLEQAGLKRIGDPIVASEGIVIARKPGLATENGAVKVFLDRLQGILLAQQYVILEYDIPGESLKAACQVTPGIESPTVSPLSKENWSAVKAMVKAGEYHQVMDRLKEIGAKGIIVTEIKTCRL